MAVHRIRYLLDSGVGRTRLRYGLHGEFDLLECWKYNSLDLSRSRWNKCFELLGVFISYSSWTRLRFRSFDLADNEPR